MIRQKGLSFIATYLERIRNPHANLIRSCHLLRTNRTSFIKFSCHFSFYDTTLNEKLSSKPLFKAGELTKKSAFRRSLTRSIHLTGFQTRHPAISEERRLEEERIETAGWLIRLGCENSYLGWTRNTYIATIAGVTINLQHVVPYAKDVAFVLFLMGGLNLLTGTSSYIYNIASQRKRILMSPISVFYHSSIALIHLLLWLGGIAIYIGYVEDSDNEDKEIIIQTQDGYIINATEKAK